MSCDVMKNRYGLQLMFALAICVLLLTTLAVGQEKKCGVTLKVVDVDGKKEITDAYAEAYVTELSQTFYAFPEASIHTFEDLNSGYYHFTVQKRGYKVSKYFLHLDCSLSSGKKETILVRLHEGYISEQENVTPQLKAEKGGSNRFTVAKPLSNEDTARLFNYLTYLAADLGKATYPPAARALKASGPVTVHVIVNEAGEIESAEPSSGHPLLRAAAKQAAQKSRFEPVLVRGKPIKIQGFIVYNFVP